MLYLFYILTIQTTKAKTLGGVCVYVCVVCLTGKILSDHTEQIGIKKKSL